MALTKASIAEHLCTSDIALTKREVKEVVELFFLHMSKALEHGRPVKLSSFGNFELHDKTERPGRNPKTGEEIPVSARRVVTFKAGQKLKHRIKKESVTSTT